MKHLSIILPNGQTNLTKLAGAVEIFTLANEHWLSRYGTSAFHIQLVGERREQEFLSGMMILRPGAGINEIKKTDLIVIPAMDDQPEQMISRNKLLINWIRHQHQLGAEVAGMCTGAFILAATGLLNNRQCTTHWWATEKFRALFPETKLVPDRIVTDEAGLYSSGGALSSFNLLLYLLEKYCDRETALTCSKYLQIDIDRSSQSPYVILSGQKGHNDQEILESQEFIEKNAADKISVAQLAQRSSISKRNFIRRFKKATGNTPVEYIQRVRIETAKRALESSRKTVNEVMYETGYADPKAFRMIFRKVAGLSPVEYRNRFRKDQF